MAAWKNSSLAVSDKWPVNDSGNSSSTRISKQNLVEHKMFGSKRKNIQIGKMFRKKGKGVMKGSVSAKMPKSSGISPSIAEFDKMMDKVSGGSSSSSSPKKKMFSRKQFG